MNVIRIRFVKRLNIVANIDYFNCFNDKTLRIYVQYDVTNHTF